MAVSQPDATLLTYGDTSRVDDVLGLIEILTAEEASIFNKLQKVGCRDTVHMNQTDTLRTAASAAVAENGDYSMLTRSTPTRTTNLVEVVAIPFRVSRTQQQVEHYQGQNELARQTTKALIEWHDAAEYDLIHGTLTSGQSGVAPKLSGLLEAISRSTNYTAQSSGTVWSASILKGLMKANWDESNGDVATDLYMGSFLKDKTDDFANKTNIVSNGANVNQIISVVDVFESGFGKLAVHAHRRISLSSDASARVLGIRPDKLAIAQLQAPTIQTDLARSGDYDERAVIGKFTLEVRNRTSNFHAYGFDKD